MEERWGERKERKRGREWRPLFCVQKGGKGRRVKKKENKKTSRGTQAPGPWRRVFSSEDHGLPFSDAAGVFSGFSRFLPGFLDFYSFIFCMRVWQRVR
jgi:hypothetical protein